MSPIVEAWIAIGVIGVLIDLPYLLFFVRDRRKLAQDHLNGGDEILNSMYLAVGVIASLKHTTIIVIGAAAAQAPRADGTGSGPPVSAITLILTGGLFLEAILTVCTPVVVLYFRNALRVYLRSVAGTTYLTHLMARIREQKNPLQSGGSHAGIN